MLPFSFFYRVKVFIVTPYKTRGKKAQMCSFIQFYYHNDLYHTSVHVTQTHEQSFSLVVFDCLFQYYIFDQEQHIFHSSRRRTVKLSYI